MCIVQEGGVVGGAYMCIVREGGAVGGAYIHNIVVT